MDGGGEMVRWDYNAFSLMTEVLNVERERELRGDQSNADTR